MKASEIFRQYIWLTDTIFRSGGITFQELNERWVKTEMSGGVPMIRQTFNRHREAIQDMFGVNIECQTKGGYYYYIENTEMLKGNDLKSWMLDSLSIGNMLMDSSSLKNRIVLENIPVGKEYLRPIINAMKEEHKLQMTYQKFGQQESYTILVEPYAIKVFKQRWYLLAKNNKRAEPTIYALDRIVSLEETNENFNYPSDFDAEQFFKDCYGVLCGTDDKAQKIVVRAYYPFTNYLRTLPIHHSQKELASTSEYADFEFYLRPTFDFRQELFSQINEVEVLEPISLRQDMKNALKKTLERYE